jgi:uroporphyrinogen decarboxylase
MKEILTSRERVKRAINRQPVDRMPIDLGAHGSSGISAFAYWELRERLGLATDKISISELIPMLARVDDDILRRFHIDFKLLKPPGKKVRLWQVRGKYSFFVPASFSPVKSDSDEWMVANKGRMKMPAGGFFFDRDRAWWPEIEERDACELLAATAREAEKIYKETEYYTIYNEFYSFFRQDIEWMCRMVTEPQAIYAENQAMLKQEMANAAKMIQSMGQYVQAVSVASDLGTQQGPFVNPQLYDDLCAPFLEKFCQFIHENSDMKIMMHSCGSIARFLPTLIRCSIDMINPVQISAADMEPADLKQRYGSQIVFWGGGCDTQNVLEKGSEQEIRSNVRALVRMFKDNYGYIFSQVHNIMGNIPPQNIMTMLDTAYEESFYQAGERI